MCSIEHTIYYHAVDVEVWLNLVVADVQHLLFHLGRIIETVIWLQLEVWAHLLLGIVLDSLGLCLYLWLILCYQLLQEVVHIVRVFSHRLLERIRCIVLISHQLSLLGAQLGYLHHQRKCIECSATISTTTRSIKHTATQIAIVQTCQDSLLGGIYYYNSIRSLASAALCILLTLGDISITQASQLLLGINPNHSIVCGSRQHIAPLLL